MKIAAPLVEVWRAYTTPADILQWNAASDDWQTTAASVDLRDLRPPPNATAGQPASAGEAGRRPEGSPCWRQ